MPRRSTIPPRSRRGTRKLTGCTWPTESSRSSFRNCFQAETWERAQGALLIPYCLPYQTGDWRGLGKAQRPVHDANELLREYSDVDGREGRHTQGKSHASTDRKQSLVQSFAHKHLVRDTHVVIKPEHRVEDGERCQHIMAALNQAEEDKILSIEASQGWDTRQREQENKHQHGFGGRTEIKAGDVVHLVANHIALP